MGRPRGSGTSPPEITGEEGIHSHGAGLHDDLSAKLPLDQSRQLGGAPLAFDPGFYVDYADSLKLIAERLPARSTVRQAYAFLLIVAANSMGRSITAKSLRDVGGTRPDGEEVLGQAIQKTYQVLLDPSEYNEDGVGWVQIETDKSDRRNNLLRLTPAGERIANEIMKLLRGVR